MVRLIYPKFWQSKNIIAYLLWPLSCLYLLAGYVRKIIARPILFPCKVICVGNISVGGTGKTQIVIFLAKLLTKLNINFIIVTKAYGSKLKKSLLVEKYHTSQDVGDESIILSKYGRVIATKKIQYLSDYINKLTPQVIIVDDSMQNPHFYKDLVILSIDADRLFGNEFLIPAGPLRQYPNEATKKADIIISVGSAMTRGDISYFSSYNDKIGDKFGGKFFQAQIIPSIKMDTTKSYFAFSGIGNPERFFATLENYGLKLSGHKIFPDHYNYSSKDLSYLKERSEQDKSLLITTRKDYVKIGNSNLPIICCDVDLSINNQELLVALIYEKIL
jgi:tetraacyldisaccharide 4'-kinase